MPKAGLTLQDPRVARWLDESLPPTHPTRVVMQDGPGKPVPHTYREIQKEVSAT